MTSTLEIDCRVAALLATTGHLTSHEKLGLSNHGPLLNAEGISLTRSLHFSVIASAAKQSPVTINYPVIASVAKQSRKEKIEEGRNIDEKRLPRRCAPRNDGPY